MIDGAYLQDFRCPDGARALDDSNDAARSDAAPVDEPTDSAPHEGHVVVPDGTLELHLGHRIEPAIEQV